MKIYHLLLWLSSFIALPYILQAQGCSDAGFCSMGALRPDQDFEKESTIRIRAVSLSQYVARTKFEDILFVTTLEGNLGIGDRNSIQVKVPYLIIINPINDWEGQGVGDISLSYTRTLVDQENIKINATIGAKIPTDDSDVRLDNGQPIPMYFQPSLGSYDLVLGGSILTRKWLIGMGLQKPLYHINRNQFSHRAWQEIPRGFQQALLYPESVNLRRRSDAMLRVERNIRLLRWSFNVGMLWIYRFRLDRMDDAFTGEDVVAPKSSGLAWSVLLGTTYRFSVKSQLKILLGQRIIQRKNNPDGLSREQVSTVTYTYSF